MRHYGSSSYQESEVLSASPLELVRLMYRGTVEAIATARRCLAAGDIAGRSQAINKAFKIITELMFSLDREREPELSKSLLELYDYVQRLLIDANCRQADPPLAEAQRLVTTLQEGWENCEAARAARVPHRVERVYEPVSCSG